MGLNNKCTLIVCKYHFLLKDQQDNAVITEEIVEDVLELVIPGTGHKDAGWGETAGKLAEDAEQGVSEMNLKSTLMIIEPLLYVNKQT